jgi:hypothetical protein
MAAREVHTQKQKSTLSEKLCVELNTIAEELPPDLHTYYLEFANSALQNRIKSSYYFGGYKYLVAMQDYCDRKKWNEDLQEHTDIAQNITHNNHEWHKKTCEAFVELLNEMSSIGCINHFIPALKNLSDLDNLTIREKIIQNFIKKMGDYNSPVSKTELRDCIKQFGNESNDEGRNRSGSGSRSRRRSRSGSGSRSRRRSRSGSGSRSRRRSGSGSRSGRQ